MHYVPDNWVDRNRLNRTEVCLLTLENNRPDPLDHHNRPSNRGDSNDFMEATLVLHGS